MRRKASGPLTVTEVAEIAGVTPRTVRYYHSIGLLPEPTRDSSGYRRYGGKDVVALVRVTRLRGLGMPLAEIAERVGETDSEGDSIEDALRALATEIDDEINRLTATRDRLRELAGSDAFARPVKALTRALQDQGVLGPADQLRAGEGWAAAVLDALHPQGMTGVLAEATRLFADPSVTSALRPLRRRLGRLGPKSSDADIADLAADVAAVLPAGGVEGLVDMGLVDSLLADRLNPTQQRFVHALLAELAARR